MVHAQPLDPNYTAQHGWGVCVVPVAQPGFVPMPMMCLSAPSGPFVPKSMELQYARCMSARYKSDAFPRCVSCTRRWAGDTCRFQNIRLLGRDANKNLVTTSFQGIDAKVENVPMLYPDRWNVPLERRHVERTLVCTHKRMFQCVG